MAHIRRQDFLKNLIYELFYWPLSSHPAAMFMRKQIAATRELACDEMATQRLIDPVRYAHSLIGLATFRRKNKA
jgi:beta-lactamase regulating signal transducer with metallopeptidase domain